MSHDGEGKSRPPSYASSADKLPDQLAQEILHRRLAEENAVYARGFPVAGHDTPPAVAAKEAALREIDKDMRNLERNAEAAIRQDASRSRRR